MRFLIYMSLVFASLNGIAENNASGLNGTMWGAWGRVSCVDDNDKEVSIASLDDVMQGLVDGSALHDRMKTVDGNHEGLVLKFNDQTLTSLVLLGGWDTNEPKNGVDGYVMTRIQTVASYAVSKDGKISTRYLKSRSIIQNPDFLHGDITKWWDSLAKRLESTPFTNSLQMDLVDDMIARTQIVERSSLGMSLKLKFDDKNPHDMVYSQVCMPGAGSKALLFSFSATTEEQMKQRNVDR